MGRCKATNLCEYCARIEAVVVSEMLALDALEDVAPTVWCVLTTSETEWDAGRFKAATEQLVRAVRRRWPAAQYVGVVEFTTGYGPRSGGKRRPHWNLLWKGIGPEDVEELQAVVARVWCSRIGAEPHAQYVGAVSEVGGLMRYLALHFLKESQAPPAGWSGKRVRASAGYFGRPRWEVRRDATESLRLKRELRRAILDGLDPHEAELAAHERHERARGKVWDLVHLTVDRETGELLRVRPLHGGDLRSAPRVHSGYAVDESWLLPGELAWIAAGRPEGGIPPPVVSPPDDGPRQLVMTLEGARG